MSKPEVMLLGTIHMAMEPQTVNDQQDHIHTIVEAFKKFNPTKIAVEKSFLIEEELDRKYREFLSGELKPAYDEVEQIAFRLAHQLEHPRVYPVDEVVDMNTPSLNQVFEWAKEYQPELFQEILEVQSNLKKMENDEDLLHSLSYINRPDYIQELQRVYMKLAKVGDRQHQVGVQWLKQWHHRDLAVSANIARMSGPHDRILVLIGGDHLHLLNQFLTDSGDFIIQSPLPYLPE